MVTPHFRLDAVPDLAPLREAFKQADFYGPTVAKTLAVQSITEGTDVPLVMLRTEEPTPYHAIVRLFVLEQVVPENRVRQALSPMPLESLIAANLLKRCEGGVFHWC